MYATVRRREVDGWRVAVALLAGALAALALGVYGRVHEPTGAPTTTLLVVSIDLGSSMLGFKSWLTTLALALGVAQLLTGLRVRGVIGGAGTPLWLTDLHRLLGTSAVLVSIPVAYHCLWSLGFRTAEPRVLVHSLLGCFFYGAFVSKELAVHLPRLPDRLVPLVGGTLFTALVGVWMSSALLFLTGGLG